MVEPDVEEPVLGSVPVPVVSDGGIVVLSVLDPGTVLMSEPLDVVEPSVVVPVSAGAVAEESVVPELVASCFVQAVASISAAMLPINRRLRFISVPHCSHD